MMAVGPSVAVQRPESHSGRLQGLDLIKGLSIIGVVLIHATAERSDVFGVYFVEGTARLAVPCFLAVTGFLAGLKETGPRRFRQYLFTFVRLHLLYGFLYGVLTALVRGVPDPVTAKFVLLRFGESAYPGQYYFVILIQLFLFTSLLPSRMRWRSPAWVWASAAVAAGGVVLLVMAPQIAHALHLPGWATRILGTPNGLWLWFYYFALGAHLGARSRVPAERSGRASALLKALPFAGIAIATLGLPEIPHWEGPLRLGYTYARLPIYLGATLVVLALPHLAGLRTWRPLARVGRDSFGIFVMNPAALLLTNSMFGAPSSTIDIVLHGLLAIVLCSGITAQVRRHLPWALP